MDEDADGMMRAGCARRSPQRLQTGNGYARGGRVAMDRVEGKPPREAPAPMPAERGPPRPFPPRR